MTGRPTGFGFAVAGRADGLPSLPPRWEGVPVTDRDDAIWRALTDPTRRLLLDRLRSGAKTTGALCEGIPMSRFGVMRHLELLEQAGLILVERRGRERLNHLNAARLHEGVERWISPFAARAAETLLSLKAHLSDPQETPPMSSTNFVEIRQQIELPAGVERAFEAMTREVSSWWIPPYRVTGAGSVMSLDPRIDGLLVERSPDGHEFVWARVQEIRAPEVLHFSGPVAMEGAVAATVFLDLEPLGPDSCRLTLRHCAMGRISEETRAMYVAGWMELLDTNLRAVLQPA